MAETYDDPSYLDKAVSLIHYMFYYRDYARAARGESDIPDDPYYRPPRFYLYNRVQVPPGWRRILQRLWRIPQAALGWLLVGSLSRPIPDLAGEIREAGLPISRRRAWMLGSLELDEAERPR